MADSQAGAFYYVLDERMEILFADDDPILREFAAVQLASEQAVVHLAEDGCAALLEVRDNPIDLIVLDLEMPEMDGFEVLAALKRDPATADIPVIVCTGREDVAAIDRAFQAGATSFLVKPINWRLLSYQIRFVFRAHRQERTALQHVRALAASSARLLSLVSDETQIREPAAAFANDLARLARRAG